MSRQETSRVGSSVLVGLAPLEALRCDPVGCQRAASRCETACDDNGLIGQPGLVVRQHLRMESHILGAEVRLLVRLGVDPAEGLQVPQMVVVRQLRRQGHASVVAHLGNHHHASDLLHLRIVRRRNTVEVCRDLSSEVRNADEGLQDVLGHDVRVARFSDVLTVHVEVVCSQVERGRRDGSNSPLRAGGEGLLLVRRASCDDHLLTVDIGGLGGDGRHLGHLLALLLQVGNLLSLDGRRSDLHTQNDIPDLALRQRSNVDVVFLSVIRQDQILELHLDLDPLVISERRPHVMRLSHGGLVGLEDDLGSVGVDVQGSQDQDHSAECSVRGDGLEPVVVQVEENHLRLSSLQDKIAEFFDLHAGLERQRQLGALDHDVGEIQQVDLERVQHALSGDDDLLGLLLHGQGPDQSCHLLGRLPLSQLRESLLAGPDRGVDNLQEELSGSRVEDEDSTVYWFRGQITFESLVDRDSVHVGVINEPDDLGAEELSVVLGIQVRLCGLRAVELQTLSDSLSQHVQGGIGLHDLVHGAVQQRLHTWEPVAEATVQVVGQVDAHQCASGRRVDGHVVGGVIQELGTAVPLNIMRIVIAPSQLHVDPVLSSRSSIETILGLGQQGRLGDSPLVGGEEQDVGTRGIHLVGLSGMDRLLLHHLDLEGIQLEIEHLAQIHDHTLVDLLPQVRSEDLDQRDLQGGDFAVHEDAGQIQLHLETNIHVGSVDGRRPPQGEASVGDLVETGSLGVGQFLEAHGLLEATRLLPEETLPGREVSALEQGVLQDALDTTQGLDHVGTIVVQIPQLAVVPLVCPPEGVLPHDAVLFEVLSHTPALVESQGVSILLEQSIDSRDSTIPGILQILQSQAPVLGVGLLPLQRILGPDSLRVDELGLPGLDVAVQIGNQLVLFVRQTTAVVGDAGLSLLGISQIGLRDQNVTHTQHAQASQLLGCVEHHRRESRRHLGVQTDLDTGLDLVLALHQEIEQGIGVDHGLSEVGHHANEVGVPLVGDLGEGRGTRGHQNGSASVLELLLGLVVDLQEGLRCHLLGRIVLQLPDTLSLCEFLLECTNLGQDSHFEATHIEEDVGVVLGVDRGEAVVPDEACDAARQAILHLPEHSASQVDIVLHAAHSAISGPAHLVVVADNVLVVGVRVFSQEPLDQVSALILAETEHHDEAVQVSAVQPNGVSQLCVNILEGQEFVGQLRWSGQLGGSCQAQLQEVQDETVVLEDEGSELQSLDQAVGVGVVHVLVVDDDVVLGRHVVGDVVVDD
mmetsp:Transcript_39335/g.83813  ORF Transcript_39335/g.83813 Transcript_39335/m.83813 type:complete len:1257 (-) Transcript_39335:3240-7010(-)